MDYGRRSPTEFATKGELYGNGERPGIIDLADAGSDKQFEAAVAEAKAERNLSRAAAVVPLAGPGARRAPEILYGGALGQFAQLAERVTYPEEDYKPPAA